VQGGLVDLAGDDRAPSPMLRTVAGLPQVKAMSVERLAGAFGAPLARVQVLNEGGADGAQRQRPGIGVAVDVAGVGEDVPSGLII
jgi:hypothetical protein